MATITKPLSDREKILDFIRSNRKSDLDTFRNKLLNLELATATLYSSTSTTDAEIKKECKETIIEVKNYFQELANGLSKNPSNMANQSGILLEWVEKCGLVLEKMSKDCMKDLMAAMNSPYLNAAAIKRS